MTWSKAISLAEYKKMIRKQRKQDRRASKNAAEAHARFAELVGDGLTQMPLPPDPWGDERARRKEAARREQEQRS